MKLFLREHLLLIMVQCLQFGLIMLILWLAGFRDIKLLVYSCFLGIVLLILYLIYQYITRRAFYKRLSKPLESMQEALVKESQTPLYHALHQLLKSNYQLYQDEIIKKNNQQEEQRIFMDLWVHQMKTPISVIDLTARELDEPYSSNIRDENEKLKAGLNTVLHMSRLRLINQDFHIKQLSLQNVIEQVNQDNRRLFIRNRVYPKMETDLQESLIESDEKWLFFMLSQLVHNAVKYSATRSNQFVYRLHKRNERMVLEVKDFGIGIPKEDIDRIYDPFFTGANGREHKESTGVGLYVTKEVADYLGHTLEVESKVGKGTIFRILF